MDVAQHYYHEFQDFYAWCLTKADPRVENWFLMQSYTPTLVLTALYLLIVWGGKKFMKNREAVPIHRYLIFLYNAALVALNFYIFYEIFMSTYLENYNYSCTPVDYSNNPNALRLANGIWWYYFSKCVEFMDTFIFILRKKNNQVSFLHVYHHATMFPIWWMGVKWVPGGQSFFGAMINSFIHVIMYSYYGVAALGPQYQKYLWWKRYLTTMQLTQFCIGFIYAAQSIYFDCDYPKWMQWTGILYGIPMTALFTNFYIQAYLNPKEKVQFIAGMFHSAQSLALGCNFPAWMQWSLITYGASIFSLFMNFYYHSYVKTADKGKKNQANGTVKEKNGHAVANGKSETKKRK